MDIFCEITDMLQAYCVPILSGKNTQAAIRLYHQRFLNRTVPHYKKNIKLLHITHYCLFSYYL
jgi:hypothetical protein